MDIEALKKQYRQLLKQYHPDTSNSTDDSMIKKLIDEYQKLSKLKDTSKPHSENKLQLTEIVRPTCEDDVNKYLLECAKCIANNKLSELNQIKNDIFLEYVQSSNNNQQQLCLTAISMLIDVNCKPQPKYDIEYENIYHKVSKYMQNVVNSKNYFEMLEAINSPKQLLLADLLKSLQRIKDETLIEIIECYLIFIICLEI